MNTTYNQHKNHDDITFLIAKNRQAKEHIENGFNPCAAEAGDTAIELIRRMCNRLDSVFEATDETQSFYLNENGISIDVSSITDEVLELERDISKLATLMGMPPISFSKTVKGPL